MLCWDLVTVWILIFQILLLVLNSIKHIFSLKYVFYQFQKMYISVIIFQIIIKNLSCSTFKLHVNGVWPFDSQVINKISTLRFIGIFLQLSGLFVLLTFLERSEIMIVRFGQDSDMQEVKRWEQLMFDTKKLDKLPENPKGCSYFYR